MATTLWSPGEFINPGDLRAPRSTAPTEVTPLQNGDLEGTGGWTFEDPSIFITTNPSVAFNGTKIIYWAQSLYGTHYFKNDEIVEVVPGQVITCRLRYRRETNNSGRQGTSVGIAWYESDGTTLITTDFSAENNKGATGVWYEVTGTFTAPANAAYAQYVVAGRNNNDGGNHGLLWDSLSWDYIQPAAQEGLVYRAVQANAGFTGAEEPDWPITLGATVVDNEVTWEAVLASSVTWQATPILKSGSSEPTWPVEVGAQVADGTVAWVAISRRIEDEKCPNSKVVAIGASKVFAADDDIINYCCTVNPLDWSTADDAGYLPFGLQTYGSNPVAAMGLYRSNLVAFNSQGFQMWQIDQDPQNMAFLDAVPAGSTYPRAVQPVANDLMMLTAVGARNISVAGASTNLQYDGVGEPIDPLVKAAITGVLDKSDVLGLFWPAAGQYWLIFGDEAFVLTINGAKKKSWSRYTFPEEITDWTLDGDDLLLRTAEDNILRMDSDLVQDMYSAAVPGDLYYTSVVLSIHANGDDGSTSFVDSSGYVRTVTAGAGSAVTTANKKFGSGALSSAGNGVSCADSEDFNLSTGDWTIEGWVYRGSGIGGKLVQKQFFSSLYGYDIQILTNGVVFATGNRAVDGSSAYSITSSSQIPVDTWTHVAMTRSGNVIRVFIGGALVGSQTLAEGDTTLADNAGPLQFGLGAMLFDDLRMTKGVARYTAAFTPPTEQNPDNAASPESGEDIVGVMQWPFLDMGIIGREKMLEGVDLVATAPEGVTVSIGYNQNDRTQRTAEHSVDPDTLTGTMVPFPVSGPSFDLRLTFAAGQEWEWIAANMYSKDTRRT